MISFQNSVVVARPVDEVFAYLADLEHVPEWNHAIEETRKITPGPVGVGSRYRQRRSLPRPGEEVVEVTALEPTDRLSVAGALGPFDAELDYRLAPAPAGTEITNVVRLRPRGVAGLVGRLAASRIRDAVGRNLGVLKDILERGQAG